MVALTETSPLARTRRLKTRREQASQDRVGSSTCCRINQGSSISNSKSMISKKSRHRIATQKRGNRSRRSISVDDPVFSSPRQQSPNDRSNTVSTSDSYPTTPPVVAEQLTHRYPNNSGNDRTDTKLQPAIVSPAISSSTRVYEEDDSIATVSSRSTDSSRANMRQWGYHATPAPIAYAHPVAQAAQPTTTCLTDHRRRFFPSLQLPGTFLAPQPTPPQRQQIWFRPLGPVSPPSSFSSVDHTPAPGEQRSPWGIQTLASTISPVSFFQGAPPTPFNFERPQSVASVVSGGGIDSVAGSSTSSRGADGGSASSVPSDRGSPKRSRRGRGRRTSPLTLGATGSSTELSKASRKRSSAVSRGKSSDARNSVRVSSPLTLPSLRHDAISTDCADKQLSNPAVSETEPQPVPQNLRGDPFRSAKIKTELCRHFGTPAGCPFGDKCNFAHGQQELKLTRLMDLERAGLLDVETFRTHPCPTWVATGSCPLKDRCIGIHDPRLSHSQDMTEPPSLETIGSSSSSSTNDPAIEENDAHFDRCYHHHQASVYSCSPFCGYVPRNKWTAGASQTGGHGDPLMSAFAELYSFVCNQSSSSEPPLQRYEMPSHDILSEWHRIAIALSMRRKRRSQFFTFCPTHLYRGEPCMVLQSRWFQIPREDDRDRVMKNVTRTMKDSRLDEAKLHIDDDDSFLVEAKEIAFGPPGDPSVKAPSLWFNIPSKELVPWPSHKPKHQARSRHRLKVRKAKNKNSKFSSSPPNLRSISTCELCGDWNHVPPFYVHQPLDNDAFDLATGMLEHRLLYLKQQHQKESRHSRKDLNNTDLEALEERLVHSFESQRRFWMTWSWPINMGRESVDDETRVPQTNCEYRCATPEGYEPNFYPSFFFGDDSNGGGEPVVSSASQAAVSSIWNSFVCNVTPDESTTTQHPKAHDEECNRQQERRLPVFEALSDPSVHLHNDRRNVVP